jgi:predicted MFS family arabinose efflux permease
MLVWGWRVPFLLAVLTLVAAIVLRYNMPESQEVRGHQDMRSPVQFLLQTFT